MLPVINPGTELMQRIGKWILPIALLGLAIAIGYFFWIRAEAGHYEKLARNAYDESDFMTARVYAEKALAFDSKDSALLLIHAESAFKDQSLDQQDRIRVALASLESIPDKAEEAPSARRYEASIYFFNLLKPCRAEQALQRAAEVSDGDFQTHMSLFQIYCCTGRESLTESLFKKLVEMAKTREQKVEVLKAWFLSQFSPSTFNSKVDNQLQVDTLIASNIPASQKRLLAFRNAEPDQQLAKIALVNWFFRRNDGQQAKKLLDELSPEFLQLEDPLYLLTAINVYLEMGEIDLARELHSYWTDESHFEYWRQKGVFEQDYDSDPAQAVESFKRALQIWPGTIDPSIYFRLETCLTRQGQVGAAGKFRERGIKVRNTTEVGRIKVLQSILLNQQLNPSNCEKFAEFYSSLGRDFEKQQWQQLATQLSK